MIYYDLTAKSLNRKVKGVEKQWRKRGKRKRREREEREKANTSRRIMGLHIELVIIITKCNKDN